MRVVMRVAKLLTTLLLAVLIPSLASAQQPDEYPVWGSEWVAGGYHQHDLQLSKHVGLSLDWRGTGINSVSLSYTSRFAVPAALIGLSPEEPLTLRVTLRGWELYQTNADDGSDFFSFDRIRDREIRKQLIMVSISKHF